MLQADDFMQLFLERMDLLVGDKPKVLIIICLMKLTKKRNDDCSYGRNCICSEAASQCDGSARKSWHFKE